MKKLLFGTIVLAATFFSPAGTMADVDVHIGIGLPPLISFRGRRPSSSYPTPPMFMLSRISRWTFFSGAAGGGVPGKGDGIAPIIMTEDGFITGAFQISIFTWIRDGGIVSGPVTGMVIPGTTIIFHTMNFKETGRPGKRTATGRRKNLERPRL